MELTKVGPNRYRLQRTAAMRVNGIVYLNDELLPLVYRDKSLEQLANAACLPGVVEPVCGMPDIHEGFGLPIGGVMACAESGVISAGAVGMDINCGVRLLRTNLPAGEIDVTVLRQFITRIEEYVPTGIGKSGKSKEITREIFEEAVRLGSQAVVRAGFGLPEDIINTEEEGRLAGAVLNAVSHGAIRRGKVQLGTLGGGNHFIEVQVASEIYESGAAEKFGLFGGQLTVMIHAGSRGFGHQICIDYSRSQLKAARKYGIALPDKGLACTPVDSPEGRAYYAAMACAVNFAFANRQVITHCVRRAFDDVFGRSPGKPELQLIYDVAHNIAKWEEHGGRRLLVHRKGATRACPPGHPSNPEAYRSTGHPVLIPGSMGTASYVLTGAEKAAESFYSVNHGTGRTISRTAAGKSISKEEFIRSMGSILINTRNYQDFLDEAPAAYKDIDQVVETLAAIEITRKVARLKPLAVIKGKD